jgi:site-specific recombinase XerD
VHQIRALAKHYHTPPNELSAEQVRAYVLHEIERGLSASTCRQAVGAMRFLYHTVLERPPMRFDIPLPKGPQAMPEILSRGEVGRICSAPANRKHRLLLLTTYAEGLRVSEVVHLRTVDIDLERKTVHVHLGKGARDRYVPLSDRLESRLCAWWTEHPKTYRLFAGARATDPMHQTTAQRVYQRAKGKAGVRKHGGIHALRHAFATHLLEAGTSLPTIQRLLGHRRISSTMRYLHLRRDLARQVRSPLDLIDAPDDEG